MTGDGKDQVSLFKEHIRGTRVDQREDGPCIYPLTAQQVEDSIQEFIASINNAAVCDLASRYNGGKRCRVIDQRNGSFNVCFFVFFDIESVTWVLRIPVEPVVSNAWAKVVSEVATIR